MSYSNRIEYEIIPEGSYQVIRNCGKCGCKQHFINTNHFRVNANGNQLDVWLIYQCEKCKHTFNLTIYERKKPSEIKKEEYNKLLANDITLATQYGNNKELFIKNKSEICLEELQYRIIKQDDRDQQPGENIIIKNPYMIKVRTERVLAEILQVTRSVIKSMVKNQKLSDLPQYINRELEIMYTEDDKGYGNLD